MAAGRLTAQSSCHTVRMVRERTSVAPGMTDSLPEEWKRPGLDRNGEHETNPTTVGTQEKGHLTIAFHHDKLLS